MPEWINSSAALGRTHSGAVCERLCSLGRTHAGAREQCEEEAAVERSC